MSGAPHLLRHGEELGVAFWEAAIGMAFLDFEGSFLAVNPALCDLVGRTEDDLLLTSWRSITHADDVAPGQRSTAPGPPERLVGAEGRVVWVVVSESVVQGVVGQAECLLRQVVDVSEQRRLQEELSRLAEVMYPPVDTTRLESALIGAARPERGNITFLADAAHQLRNPVAGVRACAECLLRGPDAAGRDRLLAEIARETSHLSRLVDRLLQIARLEQGEPLRFEPYDLRVLCEDEVERAGSLAPHLSIVLAAEGPMELALDPWAIRQCLGALLENARRHAVRRITVSVCRDGGTVSLSVRDDGPGLPDGAEADVFEPFVSLDGMGGFGLGLTLARMLARAHRGDLTYEDGAFVVRVADGADLHP